MQWRKRWARSWPQVKHCSAACRRRGIQPLDRLLETATLDLLAARAGSATLCPSEVARRVAPESWRSLMERSREAARRLASRDAVVFLQQGRPVDPSTTRGAVRLGRGPGWPAARP
ncbi:MAG: DUF3253 domain-containing protein [Gemmatimonadales bacterium]|nr:MAG: DUF3253 domain-containing protein [Gemmatimonadales bacterium]